MQASSLFYAAVLAGLLALIGSCGCSGTPDKPSTFAMPSIGGVPDQWEPELSAAELDEIDLEAELDETDSTY